VNGFNTKMTNVNTIFEGLDSREIDYVYARANAVSDAEALRSCGFSRGWLNSHDKDDLNERALKFKTDNVLKAQIELDAALPDAAKGLVKLLKSQSENIKLRAQTEIMDRRMGKPAQMINQTTRDESVSTETDEDALFMLPANAIAGSFYDVYRDIHAHRHTEYVFKGGRGSTKSSFASEVLVELLINNPEWHALVTRQVANTLRDSVYSQIVWAINYLGLSEKFKCTTSPLEITYIPTGQKIYFRGGDDPLKIKSIKPRFGYINILWFEELDQFRGSRAVRSIVQSALRGGDQAYIFKSFNPPRSRNNWVNKELDIPKDNRYVHESDYRSVPKEWLGQAFLDEAEFLKEANPGAYNHEYLGEATTAGGLVFENVECRKITDEEIYGEDDGRGHKIGGFDRILNGLDWGYFPDPAQYNKMHYDAARMTLYIFGEYRGFKHSNRELYDKIIEAGYKPEQLLIPDSAEPKSIADFRAYGAHVRGAEKGPESVRYSMKWLQSLVKIVIDNERCPYTAQEFLNYEHEINKDGEYVSEYPDKDNHAIDAVRYATNLIWRRRGQ
jgi:phage terminase large subunit